ncbi:MAG: universal stress protein, partial [Pyrinomonadaceae bacterium]|nr:universal stress protein [Pyrinomonadaceae bacterium]
MKILIGYDGSKSAEASLDDLQGAGLPADCEALVFSIAEVWLPPQSFNGNGSGVKPDDYKEVHLRKHYKKNKRAVGEAETFARHAGDRLRAKFPGWKITTEATFGSPGWEILDKADVYEPDLIVVGSQGRTAIGRFFLGSISNKVLTEAKCSVRVARGKIEVDPFPVRVMIGFDGLPGSKAAVEAVAARCWRDQSEIRLVAASSQIAPVAIERFVPPIARWVEDEVTAESEWIERLAESSLQVLRDAGIATTLHIIAGNPKQVLIEEAEKWHADSIFVGANSFGS